MNTKVKILSFFVMFAVAMLVGSCKKDSILNPYGNCNNLATDFSNAYQTWVSDPSVANCEAMVDAYNDYVSGCSGWVGFVAHGDLLDEADCAESGQ